MPDATTGTFIALAKASDIPVGQFKPVQTHGKHLLVCHTETGFSVIDDTCTHDDGPLADGWLEGNAIECPRHGARFDVKTGKVLCLPAAVPINAYAVKVDGDEVKVDVNQVIPKP
ncbi:MAG: biphenyl 2,3-dioxygenase [Candidatus Omnitrophica bacterium CG11_big_fil_rev_8_21_14_0_20_63_9]|nr:MAG: biphenyl 2,3-dioxygenase [Candidatus Omnitrophica bacterium CG11_big_fil_rev_8_21_14_0_20_63_9]